MPFNQSDHRLLPSTFNVFQRDWNTEVSTYSGYIQDQLEITKYFELIGGLRFDRFDVAFDGTTAGVNGSNPQSLSRVDDVWSHRVGAVFKPTETASIYIATSNSFLPGAGDQFGNLTVTVSGTIRLEPEEFQNDEIGFKWEVAPRLFFTGAIFELDRSNQIVVGTSGGGNIGEQVGLDADQGWRTLSHRLRYGRVANLGRVGPSDRTHRRRRDVNRTKETKCPSSRTTSTRSGIATSSRRCSARVWASSTRTRVSPRPDNAVEIPSFTRVDAAFYFDFNENWQAQVNVENIFDEEYFASAHNNNNISPGAPRQAFVTVRARF